LWCRTAGRVGGGPARYDAFRVHHPNRERLLLRLGQRHLRLCRRGSFHIVFCQGKGLLGICETNLMSSVNQFKGCGFWGKRCFIARGKLLIRRMYLKVRQLFVVSEPLHHLSIYVRGNSSGGNPRWLECYVVRHLTLVLTATEARRTCTL
jgi:hypothetical protein